MVPSLSQVIYRINTGEKSSGDSNIDEAVIVQLYLYDQRLHYSFEHEMNRILYVCSKYNFGDYQRQF